MGTNSVREQLILEVKDRLGELAGIKTVMRVMPEYSDLQSFAVTQFPAIAIVGRLPLPVQKKSSRRPAGVDTFLSQLSLDLYCYLMVNENVDTEISDVLDDIWAKLYADPTRGGLATETEVTMEDNVVYWPPFAAFKVIAKITYQHDTGGI